MKVISSLVKGSGNIFYDSMNIHEYQAKEVLGKYGVPVPTGKVAYTVDEAVAAFNELSPKVTVLKSQIHAGGRGKGKFVEHPDAKGGVRVFFDTDETTIRENATQMLGSTLVTHQNAPEGNVVKRLYVEAGSDILKEYYISLVVDRATDQVNIIASSEGGMDIEEVAEATPEKIISVAIDPATGVLPFHVRKVAFGMGLDKNQMKQMGQIIPKLYKAFVGTDADQLEINPLALIEDAEGNQIIKALDAKMGFDENALYRQPEIAALRDEDEENEYELEAKKWDLSYVKMDGTIGCMVNGAGLAMATMDIIKQNGAEPANFLDVGGGATKEKVTEALKIILSDPAVEGILVNIFGGIMRCDVIAEGVIAAVREIGITIPLVVRLEGTNVEKGKELMNNSGLTIISADTLGDAAQKIVAAVK